MVTCVFWRYSALKAFFHILAGCSDPDMIAAVLHPIFTAKLVAIMFKIAVCLLSPYAKHKITGDNGI